MSEISVLVPFVVLSLSLAVASLVKHRSTMRRVSSLNGDVDARVAAAEERLLEKVGTAASSLDTAISQCEPVKIRAVLEEFETQLVARIQKVERSFLTLGDEVTEAMDKAQALDRSASAKRSRARALLRKQEEQDLEPPEEQGEYWKDPTLDREAKLQRAREELIARGVSV